MKFIETKSFIAKDGNEYFFDLNIEDDDKTDTDYYKIRVFDKDKEEVGSLTLANVLKEKYKENYSNKFGDIKFIEDKQITETGLLVNENNELKIINREYFTSFYEDFLMLDSVKIKNEESLNNFLMEVGDFLVPEKEKLIGKINKPEVVHVYLNDGNDNTQDIRGLGIGKQLYIYASQWMGANNLKTYTQDLRTEDASNIWKCFRADPAFNHSIDSLNESIYRTDGVIIENDIEKILSNKNNSKKNIKNNVKI
jgi:hypothetical protein